MFDFIIFVGILTVFVYLISNLANLRMKTIGLNKDLIQSYIDRSILTEQLKVALLENENKKMETSEEFLKFISQSRDWAFDYIETTQEKVYSVVNKIGPVSEYLEKYDPPILLNEQRLSIIEAYKDMKSILPEDYGKLDT